MKYQIAATEHAKLPDSLKSEYEEKDGNFVLKLEGHEEVLIPKAKKDLAEQHRKEAEKRLSEAEAREAKLVADLAKAGDSKKEIEAIRAQHQVEVEKVKASYAEKEKAAKADAAKAMIAAEAQKFASEKFTVPSAIARLYQDRLAVEEVDGVAVIRVREADGKPSVKSLADLQQEFLANKEFAPIVKASAGSGGGAGPSHKGGGAGPKTITKAEMEAMSDAERHQAFVKDGVKVAD